MLMKITIFWKLFTRDRYLCPRTDISDNGRDGKVHNFLEHYQQGGTLPSEDKPIKITYFDRDLQK